MDASPRVSPKRFPELDSLRGIAALIVVIHHSLLAWALLADRLSFPTVRRHPLDLLYPLHAGHEAVLLFFILSGFVLALPYLRGTHQPYMRYLAQRTFRIYGPYLVALGISVALAAHFHGRHGLGPWVDAFWAHPVEPWSVLGHILFVGPIDTRLYNNVIWSLVYEMRISIIFPALALLVLALRARASLLLAVAFTGVAMAAAYHSSPLSTTFNLMMTFRFAAYFVVGILLAKYLDPIERWYVSQTRTTKVIFGSVAFVAYNLCFRVGAYYDKHLWMEFVLEWGSVLGAAAFLVIGLHARFARRILQSAVARFLGRISYSLYLIHAPILVVFAITMHNRVSPWLQFPAVLITSLTAAYLFSMLVEEPFMRLGRRFRSATPRPQSAAASLSARTESVQG